MREDLEVVKLMQGVGVEYMNFPGISAAILKRYKVHSKWSHGNPSSPIFIQRKTESQNQLDWMRSSKSSPTHDLTPPCQLDCGIDCCIWSFLKYLQDGDSTTSMGSPLQCSVTLSVKNFFLMFSLSLTWCSFCPLVLLLIAGRRDWLSFPLRFTAMWC